jgi:hypothetical protein
MNAKAIYLIAVVLMFGCNTTKKIVITQPEPKPVLSEVALQGQTLYEKQL